MRKAEFLKLMQRYVANIAIGPSTLRNQGAPGVTEVARRFLANLDLRTLSGLDPSGYREKIDKWTDELIQALPVGAKNWGTARKAINVFMVQAFLNKCLEKEYEVGWFKDVMETPLDKQAASKLQKLAGGGILPRWPRIKRLTPEISSSYQEYASELAKKCGIPRASLDIMLWRSGGETKQ